MRFPFSTLLVLIALVGVVGFAAYAQEEEVPAEPRAEFPARIDRSAAVAEIELRWSGPVEGTPTQIIVERLDRERERFIPVATLDPGDRRYVDRGLNAGETYCYRVRTLGSDGTLLYTARTCEAARKVPGTVDVPAAASPTP